VRALPPLVMKAFVDHFRHRGLLPAVERCLLRLDLAALDVLRRGRAARDASDDAHREKERKQRDLAQKASQT
jgi:hypothetical protein